MLEIVLLVIGLFKALRRPRLKRLTVQGFPTVDPARFAEWQQAELKATDVFLWATWGAFVIKILVNVAADNTGLSGEAALVLLVVILGGWIGGLITANVFAKRAGRLKEAAGIIWPEISKPPSREGEA